MREHSFDLLRQPWIDAIDHRGHPVRLGLYQLFERAHELRSLDEANPLLEAALLRLLLAMTHRIVQGPATSRDWREMYGKGRFETAAINDYFSRWEDRFDLFHPEYPFMQTAGLRNLDKDGNEAPVELRTQLIYISSGNNKTLFDHHSDLQEYPLSPDESAKALLTIKGYSFGGTAQKTSNYFGHQHNFSQTPLWPGLFCTLQGNNIFETLALNTLLYDGDAPIPRTPEQGEDAPVWEWVPQQPVTGAVTPKGWLHYLTARCRHVLLIPEEGGRCTIVRRIHIAQGEQFPHVEDPYFPRLKNKDGKSVPLRPLPGRMLWRDSLALFGFSKNEDYRPEPFRQVSRLGSRVRVALSSRYRCCAYGLAYNKANPLAWRKESLSVPLELLETEEAVAFLQLGMERCEEVANTLYGATARYLREVLPEGSSVGWQEVHRTHALDHFWNSLGAPFQSFLLALGDPDASEQALQQWGANLRRTVFTAFQRCVWQRYADQGKSYHAWVSAERILADKCAELVNKGV